MFNALGKYSAIIITTIIFLTLVVVVLGLNFYMSFQTEANAEAVNVAGRQRMLSQRTSKSLLNTYEQYVAGEEFTGSLKELKGASGLFDNTLKAFKNGGAITGTTGDKSYLDAASTDAGQKIVRDGEKVWQPFYKDISQLAGLLEQVENTDSQTYLDEAVTMSGEVSNRLLKLMNDLTLEAVKTGTPSQVNLAGRQRMLSQRIGKALLMTAVSYRSGDDVSLSLAELGSSREIFADTLTAFSTGGIVMGADGKPVQLEPLNSLNAQVIIKEANELWVPYNDNLLLVEGSLGQEDALRAQIIPLFASTIGYARENINTVLKLMNDLTNEVEGVASAAADQSRLIQATGIVAALLCFFVIMWRIFGQLRTADALTEAAQRETQQIFDTVDQGLFLLDGDLSMGDQHSRELENIFGETEIKGRKFDRFISRLISDSDLDKVTRYLNLLFDPKKKQKLITELNPLNEVAVQISKGDTVDNKYLRFAFTRVMQEKKIDGVLTSVADVTKEVELARELEKQSKQNEKQIEMISTLLSADATLMPLFIKNSDKAYEQVNAVLKDPAINTSQFKQKANRIMTLIHGVKGESAALSLDMIADSCHEFENKIVEVQKLDKIDGNDFVGMAVLLEQLMSYNDMIRRLQNTVFSFPNTSAQAANEGGTTATDWGHLYKLAEDVAARQEKQVDLLLSGFDAPGLGEELVSAVNGMSVQFIRNAIAHGIEQPALRKAAKKPAQGKIELCLYKQANGDYRFTCQDDGAGIDFNGLRAQAEQQGIVAPGEEISRKKLVSLIFKSSVSTTEDADADSGRGAGMSAIKEILNDIGGKIAVNTSGRSGTLFTVTIPASAVDSAAA